jgi:hypothetical protein
MSIERFTFLFPRRLRSAVPYRVRGCVIQPAQWSIKNHWAAQTYPIANVHCGIGVGVRLPTAPGAGVGMFLPGVDVPTGVARFTGIGRWNLLNRYTCQLRLVLDELFKLIQRPIVTILSSIAFCLLALLRVLTDSIQVLKADTSALASRQSHDLLAHAVVDVRDNAPAYRKNKRPFLLKRKVLKTQPAVNYDSPWVKNWRGSLSTWAVSGSMC